MAPRDVRSGPDGTVTLDLRKAGSGLFERLVDRVLWGVVLKGKGVQEHLTFFNEEILITEAGSLHSLKDKLEGKTILD